MQQRDYYSNWLLRENHSKLKPDYEKLGQKLKETTYPRFPFK